MENVWKPSLTRRPIWDENNGIYILQFDDRDWDKLRVYAAKRKEHAHRRGTKNFNGLSGELDMLGIVAEVTVGFLTGISPDFKLYEKGGDAGFDFVRSDGATLDVKGQNACRPDGAELMEYDPDEYRKMFNKEKRYSDYYALVTVNLEQKTASVQGIIDRENFLTQGELRLTPTRGRPMVQEDGTEIFYRWSNRVINAKNLPQDWEDWIHPEVRAVDSIYVPSYSKVSQTSLF